jgi:hypothetical protein
MKRFIVVLAVLLLSVVPVFAGDINVSTCIYTFTNITTVSTGPSSCIGRGVDRCSENTNCAMNTAGAETVRTEHIPSAVTHTATDWDVEVWTNDVVGGPFKYYTDAETADGALATIGGAADTQYDVTVSSGTVTYTWDDTGTDPTITTTDPPRGSVICISGFATANNGCFIVESTVAKAFSIYNTSGTAETNVTSATIVSGTNAAGSNGITSGYNWVLPKISENGALRVDATVTVTVTKR